MNEIINCSWKDHYNRNWEFNYKDFDGFPVVFMLALERLGKLLAVKYPQSKLNYKKDYMANTRQRTYGMEELKGKITEVLSKESGTMDSFEIWKEKFRMCYTMRSRGAEKRKYDDATYLLCHFSIDPKGLKGLKYVLDLDERILRFMNINLGEVDGNS